MPIDVRCPAAAPPFRPPTPAGKLIRCTSCREEFRVGDDRPLDEYVVNRAAPADVSSWAALPVG